MLPVVLQTYIELYLSAVDSQMMTGHPTNQEMDDMTCRPPNSLMFQTSILQQE